jgi:putative flippase GtrA
MALRQTDIQNPAAAVRGEHLPASARRSAVAGAVPAHLGYMARFALVGGTGVLVNSGVLYVLVEGLHWHTLAAAAVATEAAIVSNFVLNDRWTFRLAEGRTTWFGRLWRYNLVAVGGLLISLAVLAALSMGLGVHYLLANLVGIAAATMWNYLINLRVTWTLERGVAAPATPGLGQQIDSIGGEQAMGVLEDG